MAATKAKAAGLVRGKMMGAPSVRRLKRFSSPAKAGELDAMAVSGFATGCREVGYQGLMLRYEREVLSQRVILHLNQLDPVHGGYGWRF